MGFEDFDIRPGNFDDNRYFISLKAYGSFNGEACIIEMFIHDRRPDKNANYKVEEFFNKNETFNIFISYASTNDSINENDFKKIISDIGIVNAFVSKIKDKDPYISLLKEDSVYLILKHLQCSRKLKSFTIINDKQDKTGPCAKCGCVDKYNSPSPNFDNEIRCYIHWA